MRRFDLFSFTFFKYLNQEIELNEITLMVYFLLLKTISREKNDKNIKKIFKRKWKTCQPFPIEV